MAEQRDSDKVLHQQEHEAVTNAQIEAGVGLNNAAIANASVAHTVSASPTKAEVEAALNALGVKINAVLTVLRNNGIVLP